MKTCEVPGCNPPDFEEGFLMFEMAATRKRCGRLRGKAGFEMSSRDQGAKT